MDAAQREVELIFNTLLTVEAGTWTVDEQAAREHNISIVALREIARDLNRGAKNSFEVNNSGTVTNKRVGTKAWGMCVIGFVFPGVPEGLVSGAVVSWLAKGKYAQVASYLLRAVGPAALKGGGVGLAASLAAGVAWCSTPWA